MGHHYYILRLTILDLLVYNHIFHQKFVNFQVESMWFHQLYKLELHDFHSSNNKPVNIPFYDNNILNPIFGFGPIHYHNQMYCHNH